MLMIGESRRGRRLPTPRTFRDRTNPLDVLDDDEVICRYRLPRQSIIDLCEALADDLDRATNRSHSLPTSTQVMAALQYFATGSFQRVDGDLHGISQPSVSRCVNAVSTALCRRASTYIKFAADEASQRHVIGQFHDIAGFPNVLGCVDGTQIPILAPRVNEYVYVCRKGYHSLNVQGVCDAELRFTNIVAKYPGSSHDSFIWKNSSVCLYLQQMTVTGGWLLGDSGYPLSDCLMTPLNNATSVAEQRYNRAHVKTRNTIERAFGLLKMRFRCLHRTGGCLQSPPSTCAKIITACAVLHNICIDKAVPAPEEDNTVTDTPDVTDDATDTVSGNTTGARLRQQLIAKRFV